MSEFYRDVLRDENIISQLIHQAQVLGTNQASLITFPKTGRNLCQIILELYFGRPVAARSYFRKQFSDARILNYNEKSNDWFGTKPWMPYETEYIVIADHDTTFDRYYKYPIITVRDPVDSIYSYYRFDNIASESEIEDRIIRYYAFFKKWGTTPLVSRKTIVSFKKLTEGDYEEYSKIIKHFHIPPHKERLEWVIQSTTKEKMVSIINDIIPNFINCDEEYSIRRSDFRTQWSERIWNCINNDTALSDFLRLYGITNNVQQTPI